jgi:serine/threonine protein kinase
LIGSLQDFLDLCQKFGTEISEEVIFILYTFFLIFYVFQRVLKLFSELVVAISLFHTQRLVHHDLKPGNIFIDEDLNAIVGMA